MKYINGIINIVIGIALLGFGYMGLSEYFGGNQQKLEKLEMLMASGTEAVALVDSMYTTVTVGGAESYSSKYHFKVDEKSYSESFYFDSVEELLPIVKIHYMPNDPTISSANLQKQIEKVRKEKDSKVSLFIGIAGILAGIFLIYFRGIRNFINPKTIESHSSSEDLV